MDANTRYAIEKFFEALRKGNSVANPEVWANRASAVSACTMLITAAPGR